MNSSGLGGDRVGELSQGWDFSGAWRSSGSALSFDSDFSDNVHHPAKMKAISQMRNIHLGHIPITIIKRVKTIMPINLNRCHKNIVKI